MKTSTKVILIAGGAIILGIGGYIAFTQIKKMENKEFILGRVVGQPANVISHYENLLSQMSASEIATWRKRIEDGDAYKDYMTPEFAELTRKYGIQ